MRRLSEYTVEQRRVIDARLKQAERDIAFGRVHGPFTGREAAVFIERFAKERAGAK